jgi:hypothetical protein
MYRLLFLFIVLLSSCRGLKNTPPPDSNLEENLKIKLDTSAKIDFIETDYTEKLNAIRTTEKPTKTVIEKEIVVKNITKSTSSQSSLGQIVYKVPDTMKVFKNYEVIVRISKSQNNIEITENIQGKIYTKSIQTTSTMEVKLVDPTGKNFVIGLTNSEVQLVDSSYTEWRFDVKPIKSGLNKLNLVVSIIKDSSVKQVVLSDDILVKSNPPAQIQNAWSENWKWIFEKMIIPLAVWLFGVIIGRWSKKKRR